MTVLDLIDNEKDWEVILKKDSENMRIRGSLSIITDQILKSAVENIEPKLVRMLLDYGAEASLSNSFGKKAEWARYLRSKQYNDSLEQKAKNLKLKESIYILEEYTSPDTNGIMKLFCFYAGEKIDTKEDRFGNTVLHEIVKSRQGGMEKWPR